MILHDLDWSILPRDPGVTIQGYRDRVFWERNTVRAANGVAARVQLIPRSAR